MYPFKEAYTYKIISISLFLALFFIFWKAKLHEYKEKCVPLQAI